MKRIWALDCGEGAVTALVAEPKADGQWRLLAHAEAPADGIRHGELLNIGDATESVVTALRRAESACGLKCERLLFNFDDAALEGFFPSGSRTLTGEGQIRPSDVEHAASTAERLVNHFEKTSVYSAETGFLIDGKDNVENPIGVFGRQLDVQLHVLMARAGHLEDWEKVMERARLKSAVPVLSLLSSAYGVLSAEERRGPRLLWDLGKDFLNGAVLERGTLREYSVRPTHGMSGSDIAEWVVSISKKFVSRHRGVTEAVLTGDLAEKEGGWTLAVPSRVASPQGVPPLDEPRHAAAVGLLRLAASMPGGAPSRTQKDLIAGIQKRALSLINEYF